MRKRDECPPVSQPPQHHKQALHVATAARVPLIPPRQCSQAVCHACIRILGVACRHARDGRSAGCLRGRDGGVEYDVYRSLAKAETLGGERVRGERMARDSAKGRALRVQQLRRRAAEWRRDLLGCSVAAGSQGARG